MTATSAPNLSDDADWLRATGAGSSSSSGGRCGGGRAVTKRGEPKVRFRRGRWSGYFWSEGKCYERMLKATTREDAESEIREIKDAIVYGVASSGGAEQLISLAPLEPPTYAGVYALLDERGYVKIGKADNIGRRVAQLQGASPRRYRLVAILSRDKRLESTVHRRLKAHGWVRGEWFAPTPAVIAEIRAARGRF